MVLVVVKQKTRNLYPISIVELALQAFEGSYANWTFCVKDKFCPDCKLKAAYAKWILLVFLYALRILEGCMESICPACYLLTSEQGSTSIRPIPIVIFFISFSQL